MSLHRYLLILGSGADGEAQLARARAALADEGRILALSPVVSGDSVVAGDPHRYANQAMLLETVQERTAFNARLKSLEIELGRHPGDAACAIDLDLAREYAADGEMRWENPAKLGHPVFVDLAEQVAPVR